MILVIGGLASGKRTFVRSLGYADSDITDAFVDQRPVVADAQELVRGANDPQSLSKLVCQLAEKDVVTFVEMGSGVVPIDPCERVWRETCGRMCCELAASADAVVRMVCGIPTWLKGEPCRGR
ncbi:bifunctional adenosylcobinamide kinase/adenosylcobinamide-phosphate guanylyltransferase [Paratractidigestivibacter sp.]|uniref:bifunctional adenosylcobinamide kinase/adenosylcobinamide-phosphate guanylyltransferase n=1 Tax=Paratractidigestivibacter sp. TaxID=2847316 RepID=UPI002ABD42D8|nr:bifunctional adenosylcobinamide kinase/adenosylcobinamide-phosphate guanylyltransferase [Paratractidigestivibacter sp.]